MSPAHGSDDHAPGCAVVTLIIAVSVLCLCGGVGFMQAIVG